MSKESVMFESVHNYHEDAVFKSVTERAWEYPAIADSPELLADVACVALNRITPRYVRNKLDMTFYLDEPERSLNEAAVNAAVEAALRFVDTQLASGPRA
jgi:Late competence development protein ComFB